MNKHIAFKSLALFISWLTLSPLLLILDGRWKLLPKWLRMLLFFLSPLMLIVFAVAIISCYFYYQDYYYPRHHFVRQRVVENITGVPFPKYKVVDYRQSKSRMDKSDSFTLEFKEMPSEGFYKELEEHFNCFEPGKYSYSAIWGNGIEAPKGESDKDDGTFHVEIEKGSKTFYIEAGTW
jgi:hypothetical protein